MITFDTPYSGVIKQSRRNSKIIIKLENASIESPKIKKVASRFLSSLTITPMQGETQIVANVPKSVKLLASKTADGYGLRLRFTDNAAQKADKAANTQQSNPDLSNLPTKKDDNMDQSYAIVIAILLLGIAILFYLKKKTTPAQYKQQTKKDEKNSTWLFNESTQEQTHTQNSNEVAIRFQKALDTNNSVVMLDFGRESYLVLMGNGNILLDKFHDNQPKSQQEFESILQTRHEELEQFLNTKEREAPFTQEKEPLQAYKERAASLVYGDEQL
jgi:hypothetical protein